MTTALAPAPTKLAKQRRASNRRARQQGSAVGNIVAGVGAWIIGLLFISPILWMLLTSLHSEQDAASQPAGVRRPADLRQLHQLLRRRPGDRTRSSTR